MQLASHGTRAATRTANNFIPRSANFAARSIHLQSSLRASQTTHSSAQRFFKQARTLISRFTAQLTAPGLRAPHISTIARPLSGLAAQRATIQQGFSLPVRISLSRPLQAPFFPRAPQLASRSITQLGLGTARNFSSSRPLFQNLVENVPVAGRAFYEADWDVKMQKERDAMLRKHRSHKASRGRKEMAKPKAQSIVIPKVVAAEAHDGSESELEHYFPVPSIESEVMTYLLIPLAPTPTSRVPLPPFTSDHPSLLPLPALASIHASHATHSLRVSSLFARLDSANVWVRGVRCSAHSHGTEGVCTILKLEFPGWTKAEVRSVIGESGTGWCVLEEVGKDNEEDTSILSDMSDEEETDDNLNRDIHIMHGMEDPGHSFVLPTLDFSSSLTLAPPPLSSPSPSIGVDMFSGSELSWSDVGSDCSDLSDPSSHSSDSSSGIRVDPPSENGWFGFSFSSDFARRQSQYSDIQEGPREEMF